MDISKVHGRIEGSKDAMASFLVDMLRIPAIGPANGGDGETARADHLMGFLDGFDDVRRFDVRDAAHGDVFRPNILAKKTGPGPGTVWIVSHMDTVTPGDLSEWRTPPFEPLYRDGTVYGLGAEDNGQAIVSSLFAAKQFLGEELRGMSLGLALVADEETTSAMGIEWLIERGCFSPDDLVIVPDWGTTDGTLVEVAEKSLLWVKITVKGKQTHGSTPHRGFNAFAAGAPIVDGLHKALKEEYPAVDDTFMPPVSTFEPTRALETVGNINTIPGTFTFWVDCRILPCYDAREVLGYIEGWVASTGVDVEVAVDQINVSGKPSSTDTPLYGALEAAVEEVIGKKPRAVGIGGGTCANFFRLAGMDAYVWQSGGGTLHQPNECLPIDTAVRDAKVFASLFHRLCLN